MADQTSTSGGTDFGEHPDYPILMGGGRRKPAIPVGGPAITRHVAFWVPRDLVPEHQTWVKNVEKFCLALYHHLDKPIDPQTKEELPSYEPHTRSKKGGELHLLNNIYAADDIEGLNPRRIENQATRYQMFRLRFSYGSLPVQVDIELNDEFFTLSTTLDLATWKPEPAQADDRQYRAIANLADSISRFDEIATKQYRLAKDDQSEGVKNESRDAFRTPPDAGRAAPYDEIYSTIWNRLQKDIFDVPYDKLGIGKLGGKFVDFRGFIAAAGEEDKFIADPGGFKRESSAARRIGHETFSEADAVNRADALLPWLKADKGFDALDTDTEADRTEPVEFTITDMLDHRAIYATALGAQLSRKRGEQGPLQGPVTYMMLARNQARWQLGRLIRSIHTLGTLRLAALYDFQHVINSGYEMRRLDTEFDERVGTRLLGTLKGSGKAKSQSHLATETARIAEELFKLSDRLTEIGTDKSEITPIAGGLAHRTERSHLYQRLFAEVIKDLREKRIEGFPMYSDSVSRRLGGAYQLIDTIGNRHARLHEKVAGFINQLRAAQALQLQDAIRAQTEAALEVQKAIQQETDASLAVQRAISDQTTASGKLQGVLLELQRGVDYVFFLVPFPYYLSSLILKPFSAKLLEDHPSVEWVAVGGSWLLGGVLAHRESLKKTPLGQYSRRTFRWAADQTPIQMSTIISAKDRFKQSAIEIGQRSQRWSRNQTTRIKASGQRIASSTLQRWQRARALTQRTSTRISERVTEARRKIREFIGRPPSGP